MRTKFLAICCLLSLCVGCSDTHFDNDVKWTPIPGSGVIVTETRPLPAFHSVDMRLHANISLTQGVSQSVIVQADDNIIEGVETRVSGGVLVIDSDSDYDSVHGVKLTLVATEVRKIELAGTGNITGTNIVSNGTVTAVQSGVGTLALSGTADTFDGTLAGLGEVDAEDLQVRRSTILLSGTGDCRTTATSELDVTISGRGDVYYAGDPPHVRSTITGFGQLIPI